MTQDADTQRRREVAIEAAQAAAEIHLRYRGQQLERDAHAGERADYSTRADIEAEQAVRAVVAQHYPEDVVIGEEDQGRYDEVESLLQSGCWFTDPLDGTADYAHGSPNFSAVVSYVEAGEPQACAVYFPALSEMYAATRGLGATLNGTPTRVSAVMQLSDAVLAMPFRSTEPARAEMLAQQMQRVLPHIEAVRLPGPPSLMACSVASGRYDVFTMMGVIRATPPGGRPFFGQPWETAAFVLLVQEAGGVVRGLRGGPPDLLGYNVYACKASIIDELAVVMDGALEPPQT